MKRGRDLSGLMKFATGPAWADDLREALGDHLGPAMAEFDFESEELADIIGAHWASVLWGCAFEDLVTRTLEPGGRNLADDYLKRRGWNETGPTKLYIRALRTSVMSLYEVSQIEPGVGFMARDLIRSGDLVRVSERSASQTLKVWDRIGARIVVVAGKTVLSGGVLSYNAEASEALFAALQVQDKRSSGTKLAIDDGVLRGLAPLISTTWLFDTIPRMIGPVRVPVVHNRDGEEVVFHRVRYSIARGATQALIGERLDAVPALQRENAHFWNWLDAAPSAKAKMTGLLAGGMTMADGTPVLGTIELKDRALILAVTSAERAARGSALLADALGDLVGTPLTGIETIEQAMVARRDIAHRPEPAIAPEIATPLVHALLDRQYRAVLEERVPMLGDTTPRAVARTKGGRERIAAWLKHLENSSSRQEDPNDPMATYDFNWMWRELGVEDLRR